MVHHMRTSRVGVLPYWALLLMFGLVSCEAISSFVRHVDLISTEEEVSLGKQFAQEVAKQYRFLDVPSVQKYGSDVGARLVSVCDRRDIEYHFTVIDDREHVNAFALPGGWVYVYTGLLQKAQNEGELAAVVAHEIGHIAARHHTKELTKRLTYATAIQLVLGKNPNQIAVLVADWVGTGWGLKFSRDDELEADRLAIKYLSLGRYRPDVMVNFLEKLKGMEENDPNRVLPFLSTHPAASVRLEQARALVAPYATPDSVTNFTARYKDAVLEVLNRYYTAPQKK